ncbi:hypothetical protein VTO42DRAFT_8029 [Malbranchea cinnamomea]
MALVTYSDSEASDTDLSPKPEVTDKKIKSSSATAPKRIVNRDNPRKILVNLNTSGDAGTDYAENDEPAKKRPRMGDGGGAFAGFNAMLPPPKRTKPDASKNDTKPGGKDTARKVFSLKTSSTPGFERETDNGIEQDTKEEDQHVMMQSKPEDVKIKGNAMMFKPLSVARNGTRKKPKVASTVSTEKSSNTETAKPTTSEVPAPAPKPKPKASLFGLSTDEEKHSPAEKSDQLESYEPLLYNAEPTDSPNPSLPAAYPDTQPISPSVSEQAVSAAGPQSLTSIANDLNLSKSEMRQLFGRRGQEAGSVPKVLTFDTEQEYKSNAEYLAAATEEELAALRHNPVRSIAPGKHTLRQLVNAVSNQRDALEESFAAGKRNRKEAGAKYGW